MSSGRCCRSSWLHTAPSVAPRARDGARTNRPWDSPVPSNAWIIAGASSAITESPAKVTRRGSCSVGWRPPGGRVVVGAVGGGTVVVVDSASAVVLGPSSVHAVARATRSSTSASARRRRPGIGPRLLSAAPVPTAGRRGWST